MTDVDPHPLLTPSSLPYGLPDYPSISPAHYLPAFAEAFARHRAEIDAIIGDESAPTFENTIVALERAGDLLGQVSRVFLLQSEVTLLTDKEQAVPVQVTRSGVHSVIYGGLRGNVLDLRFIPLSADVKVGDEIATSGLDGIYPAGLPVARITKVDRVSDTAFARILCQPVANLRSQRQVLVLQYTTPLALHPDAAADLARASDPSASGEKPGQKGGMRADPKRAPATRKGH